MVLSPEELEKRVENAVRVDVDRLATNIDNYLEATRMGAGRNAAYQFKVGKCGDSAAIKSEVLQRTIKAYEAVGWNVTYNPHKDELEFKKKQ